MICRAFLFATLVFAVGGAFAAGTPAGKTSADSADNASDAATHYGSALKHKKRAWKHEARAADTDNAEKRSRYSDKAREAYVAAIADLGAALKRRPEYYEAATDLGYALRKTGDFRKSIGAYNYALGIKPDHFEAVEYRGEAYLAIDQLENAKEDYLTLFRNDPALAADLMTAMDTWVAAQPATTVAVLEFTEWVEERRALAGVTADLSMHTPRRW
jgi:tetratricopeptide (TPR) repeat protein